MTADVRTALRSLPAGDGPAAVLPGVPVLVVVDAADVPVAAAAGASAFPAPAHRWGAKDAQALAAADVVIVATPGSRTFVAEARAALDPVAAAVRVARIPESNLTAHLAAGGSIDALLATPYPGALEPVPLSELVRSGVPAPRMVGDTWLYAGGFHVIASEPGVGKTWLVLWLAERLLRAGNSVVYLDEEGGPELVAERLAALGARPADLNRLIYVPSPQRQWNNRDVDHLRRLLDQAAALGPVALVVLDSLPDFLAAAALDEDRARDVTDFVHRLLPPVRDAGAALVALDHLPKPDSSSSGKRSRYSRGSGAKLGKADLSVLVETAQPFDRNHSGQLRLWATKDRRGAAGLPVLGRAGAMALLLDVQVGDGALSITEIHAAPFESADDGLSRSMAAVLRVLAAEPDRQFTKNQLAGLVSGQRATKLQAIARLELDKAVNVEAGPNRSQLYSHKPDADDVSALIEAVPA